MNTTTTITGMLVSLAVVLTVVAAAPAPVAQSNTLVKRQYTDTSNQLNDGTACRDITVLFARGTTEPGNIGILVGPEFADAIATIVGDDNLAVQGVDYSASIEGFLEGGDPTGSTEMADLVQQASTQCPDTKIVMSGYSQGGQLVHNAASTLSSTLTGDINSVVIFGDPDDGESVGSIAASKVLVICHTGDDICLHGDLVLPPHLTYAENATAAAQFVASQAGYAFMG